MSEGKDNHRNRFRMNDACLFSVGVMIAVECRAWADNIEHDRMDRRGLAHFEVNLFDYALSDQIIKFSISADD